MLSGVARQRSGTSSSLVLAMQQLFKNQVAQADFVSLGGELRGYYAAPQATDRFPASSSSKRRSG